MNDKETSEIAKKVFDHMAGRREQRHKEINKSFQHMGNFIILVILFSTIVGLSSMAGIGLLLTIGGITRSFALVACMAIILGLVCSAYYDYSQKAIEEADKQ